MLINVNAKSIQNGCIVKDQIKGLLFDKDGTLFDFERTWGGWCARVLAELAPDDLELRRNLAQACGYDVDTGRFVAGSVVVNGTADDTAAAIFAVDPNISMAHSKAVGHKMLADLPLAQVCDLDQLFITLRGHGLALGVATNDFEANATAQLSAANLDTHFPFVAGYDSGFGGKPGPGMIHGFCEAVGLGVEQVAMIGDSTHDLHAGRAAGCFTVGVLTGPALRGDLERDADLILPDISHLVGALGLE